MGETNPAPLAPPKIKSMANLGAGDNPGSAVATFNPLPETPLEAARTYGLLYNGWGTVAAADEKMLPGSDLDPGVVAARIKTPEQLAAVLATGFYSLNLPRPRAKE